MRAHTARLLITLAALAAVVAGCGSGNDSTTSASQPSAAVTPASVKAARGATIQLGHFVGAYTVDVAQREGLLGNLNVKLAPLASGSAALPLMAAGRMDGVTDIGVPPLVTAAAKKVPIKMVWYAGSDPAGIYVKPGISGAADMAGKNITAPAGSIAQISLAQYLQDHGVAFSKVKFINLPPQSIVASYKTGQIAGASIWTPINAQLEAAGAKKLADQPETAFTVFTSSFIARHPAAVQLYVCNMAKAQDLRRANPDQVYSHLAPTVNLSASAVKAVMPTNPPSNQAVPGLMGTPGNPPAKWVKEITDAGRTMVGLKLIPTAPDATTVRSMFDARFAQYVAEGKCSK
jgi:taurine transport system substrate-binding protein